MSSKSTSNGALVDYGYVHDISRLFIICSVAIKTLEAVMPLQTACRPTVQTHINDLSKMCDAIGVFESKKQSHFAYIPLYICITGMILQCSNIILRQYLGIFFPGLLLYASNDCQTCLSDTYLTSEHIEKVEKIATSFIENTLSKAEPLNQNRNKLKLDRTWIKLKDTTQASSKSSMIFFFFEFMIIIAICGFLVVLITYIVDSFNSISQFIFGSNFGGFNFFYDSQNVFSPYVYCYLQFSQYSNLSRDWQDTPIWTPCYRPQSIIYHFFSLISLVGIIALAIFHTFLMLYTAYTSGRPDNLSKTIQQFKSIYEASSKEERALNDTLSDASDAATAATADYDSRLVFATSPTTKFASTRANPFNDHAYKDDETAQVKRRNTFRALNRKSVSLLAENSQASDS